MVWNVRNNKKKGSWEQGTVGLTLFRCNYAGTKIIIISGAVEDNLGAILTNERATLVIIECIEDTRLATSVFCCLIFAPTSRVFLVCVIVPWFSLASFAKLVRLIVPTLLEGEGTIYSTGFFLFSHFSPIDIFIVESWYWYH